MHRGSGHLSVNAEFKLFLADTYPKQKWDSFSQKARFPIRLIRS